MSNELNITAIVVEACKNPSTIPSILSDAGSYGYVPTEWVGILFIVLFSLSTALHIGQAGFYRLWFLFPTAVLCGLLETAGWAARYWSGVNDVNCANPAQSSIHIVDNSFLIQIVTTIIAPTPLLGAMFILFGRVIALLGSRYSRLGPKLYSAIFLTCDIVALIVQGAGGGIAASADVGDRDTTALGGNIMLGGIIFQLVAIVVYSTLATEFLVRYVRDAPIRRVSIHEPRAKTTGRMKLQLLALAIMTVLIFIRSIYRTIELADGWNGEIITTEWLFAVWDGLMITFAMFTLNILHPGMLLPRGSAISTGQSSSTLAMGMASPKA